MAIVKTKLFSAAIQQPLPTPDGSSLQELVNAFVATLATKDVLDILFETSAVGKYGLNTSYTSEVVYLG